MTATPPLTRDIGTAERNLRALLERELAAAGLSFPEWTVLTVLDGAGPRTAGQLVQSQLGGRVVPDAGAAEATVKRLLSSGLVAAVQDPADTVDTVGSGVDGPRLAATEAGEAVYRPARTAVDRITGELFGGLSPDDVEATRRTLAEIARRAAARLAQPTA